MPETNWNKINQYLLFAFGIAWASLFMMRLSNVEFGSSESISMISLFYMTAPAIAAVIVQRIFWRSTLDEFGFTLKNVAWKWIFLFTPIIYCVFFLGVLLIIFLLGNKLHIPQFGYLDFSNEHFFDFLKKTMKEQKNNTLFPVEKLQQMPVRFAPFILIVGMIMAFLVGYTINLPFTLGEELGWRGLLQKETQHWGFWRSNLFIGSLWGLWHGPLIMMGHNYPHYPILGIGLMILFCISLSFVQSYIRFKTKTVWSPAAFHGMINASSGISLMLIVSSNELVGSIAGIAGVTSALLILIYVLVFDKTFIKNFKNFQSPPSV